MEDVDVTKVAEIVGECRPALAGHHPAIQMGALADLLAMWLAGHPEEQRRELKAMFRAMVDDLVPINAHILHSR